eukprot:CAMPEP_0172491940 /NCGR_PEP_ID=MMETSP1066-20121228/22878_1 /TAXON_ID=671091 /ORGANISM="Coscinodiscus wailesii, Strain CCMP2513" /LENGTH=305 /DNA_ID=CAMNT_0013261265 /DNA_START=85 /DNA_END=1002 /DNA_ORIENTATION=-
MSRNEMIDLADKFAVMRRQEETTYKVPDYLSPRYIASNLSPSAELQTPRKSIVDDDLRVEIVHWSYKVVDYLNMDRETVSISLSLFDRFLSIHTVNKKVAQLVGLTSLYLAVKLSEQEWKMKMPLLLSHFITLSRDNFTARDIVGMEALILSTLRYHVHPPTPQSVVSHLLLMFPQHVNPESTRRITDYATFLTELSVCEYFFVTRKTSSIALAALIVGMDNDPYLSPVDRKTFLESVRQVTTIDSNSLEVEECRMNLQMLYNGSEKFDDDISEQYTAANNPESTFRTETVSPVSVTGIIDDPMC